LVKITATVLLEFTVFLQEMLLTSGSDITIVAVKKTVSNPDICPTCCVSQLSLANATLSNKEQRK